MRDKRCVITSIERECKHGFQRSDPVEANTVELTGIQAASSMRPGNEHMT